MKKTNMMTMAAVVALLAGAAWAGDVSEAQARTVAANFITKDNVGLQILPNRSVDAVVKRDSLWLVSLKPSGYLLVGGNRSAEPIYTFSADDFTEPEAGSPQEAMLTRLEKLAAEATGSDNASRWQKLLGEKRTLMVNRLSASSTSTDINIAPLVKSNWGQTYPFNGLLPVIKKSHSPVGCVATAYDQIMRYWEWPAVLDVDIVTEHTVDDTWGLKWQLLAGTDFEWESSPLDATTFDNPTSLRMSRQAIFAGMIAKMDYNTQSGAQTGQPGVNRWYTPYTCLDDSNSTLEKRKAAMIESLQQGCPFMVSVNTSVGGHAVVGDGWMTSTVDGSSWVHMNYGWQSTSSTTYYTPSSAEGVYLYQKPRPMVLNHPIRTRSTLPVSLKWAFPTKGYEDSLKDFAISYTEVSATETDWTDDLSNPKGTLEGTRINPATFAGWSGGDVLKIDTQADEAYYTWPTVVATAATKLTYDVHSDNARGMSVQVQLFDPATGWTTIDTPDISAYGECDWTKRTVDLSAYDGKGIAVRIYATRNSSSYVVSDTAGVHFDNVTLTRVREAASTALGETIVTGSLRAASISDTKLATGTTYLFTVTPRFKDATEGIPGHAQSCTIVDESVAQPTITSVSSVTSNAPKFGTDGMQRNAYLGLNQIGVYGTAAMTDLTAELNIKSLVDWGLKEDETSPGNYITAAQAASIEDAVKVEKKSSGNFLVRVDVSGLSENVLTTEMILTLRGYNSVGDVCQKDICLYFNKIDNETRIDIENLPENGGTVVIPDPNPVCFTVAFNANGGTGSTSTSYENGSTIGSFPEVSYEGYTLSGWYTAAEGGDLVCESQIVTADATYYAHWIQNATPDPDPEDPDEPEEQDEESPVVTPTFPKADGAGPNDNTEAKTRFCPGVKNVSSGVYDVTRSNSNNYMIPAGNNLIYWWIDRYVTVNTATPKDYVEQSAPGDSDAGYTLQSYTYELLDKALATTLPAGATRTQYFPSAMIDVAAWQDSAMTDNDKLVALGRHIYAALANGPIGIQIYTFMTYGAVIWGCEYEESDGGNYATALYITDTVLNSRTDTAQRKVLAMTSNNYGSGAGLLSFNSSTSGIISSLYPISAPEPASSGDGEVTVKVTAGGREFDITKAFSKVEKVSDTVVSYTLDPAAKIKVKGEGDVEEEISVKPELADGEDEKPFEVQDGKLIFKVKSIPGLKYQVLASDSLDPDSFTPAGQEREATGTRRELTVTRSGETKGFYKIQVSR